MKKLRVFIVLLLSLVFFAYVQEANAAFVTEEQARLVVLNWLQEREKTFDVILGRQIRDIRYFQGELYGNPGYYVAFFDPQGWLVVPADDMLEPVLAFGGDAVDADEWTENPLAWLMRVDVPQQHMATKKVAVDNNSMTKSSNVQRNKRWSILLRKPQVGIIRAQGGDPYLTEDTIQEDIVVAPLLRNNTWEQGTLRYYSNSTLH
jgi:hypothetical protein